MALAYSPQFRIALKRTTGYEGGYSNHPKDLGGKTQFGITEDLARTYGYLGNMRDLPWEKAEEIYFLHFWQKIGGDTLAARSQHLANEVFDCAVNTGRARAVCFLQMALNALNLQESKYADITEDGGWGTDTRGAFESFCTWRGREAPEVLLKMVICLKGHHYINISRIRPDNEEFVYGWFKNRINCPHD